MYLICGIQLFFRRCYNKRNIKLGTICSYRNFYCLEGYFRGRKGQTVFKSFVDTIRRLLTFLRRYFWKNIYTYHLHTHVLAGASWHIGRAVVHTGHFVPSWFTYHGTEWKSRCYHDIHLIFLMYIQYATFLKPSSHICISTPPCNPPFQLLPPPSSKHMGTRYRCEHHHQRASLFCCTILTGHCPLSPPLPHPPPLSSLFHCQ